LLDQGNSDITVRCAKCPATEINNSTISGQSSSVNAIRGSSNNIQQPDSSCNLHPVQQGDVSSTEPPLPEPSVNGHSPEISAYFEAVEHYISSAGWVIIFHNISLFFVI